MNNLLNKKILLVICGGISAYKSLEVIRGLKKRNSHIKTILTKSAKEFVTPLSITSLSQEKVYDDIFNVENDSAEAFLDTDELYDIIIADPPYELTEAKNGTTGKSLIDLCFNRLKLHGTFILEMSSKSDIKGDREKYYGDTKLVFWNK